MGIVTIKSKPARYLLGGKGGVALVMILSTAIITISIPTSTAIEMDSTLQTDGGQAGNPYGFTGESQFGEADDLIFLRARYYDPSIGRFISRDPILEPMQLGNQSVWILPYLMSHPKILNPYVYCGNNPINHIDPTGLVAWGALVITAFVTWGIVSAIGGGITWGILSSACASCMSRAMDRNNRARRELDCEAFLNWQKNSKSGAECAEVCGKGLMESIKLFWSLFTKTI